MTEHWPTLEETEAEDRAAGRIDEAKVAEWREKYRRILATLEPQEDEPGAMEDVAREIEEWAPLRKVATSKILGGDEDYDES